MGFEADFEKWKTEYFGEFCFTQCEKTCCDMGNVSLSVNAKELETVFGGKIVPEDFKEIGIKTDARDMYSIETKCFCKQFDETTRKCLIYERRPASCRAYPLLEEKDAVIIKSGCSLNKGGEAFKKLASIASRYGKVIVKRAGK